MTTSEEIVLTARKWLGTPFHPQGRVMGAGTDCLGLIMGVATQLNITSLQGRFMADYDQWDYNIRHPNAATLLHHLNLHLLPAIGIKEPGMVISCISTKEHIHLGIISSPSTFIHACMLRGKVVEEMIPNSSNKLWMLNRCFYCCNK